MSLAKDVKPYVDNDVYKRFTKMIIKGGTRFYYLLDLGGGKYGGFLLMPMLSMRL